MASMYCGDGHEHLAGVPMDYLSDAAIAAHGWDEAALWRTGLYKPTPSREAAGNAPAAPPPPDAEICLPYDGHPLEPGALISPTEPPAFDAETRALLEGAIAPLLSPPTDPLAGIPILGVMPDGFPVRIISGELTPAQVAALLAEEEAAEAAQAPTLDSIDPPPACEDPAPSAPAGA